MAYRDQGRQGEATFVGRGVVNTPTELSAGIRHKFVSDTLGINTPTEISGGIIMVNGHERTVPLS